METKTVPGKVFDLEARTFRFAMNVRGLLKTLKPNEVSFEDRKQVYRSSGSVAANYVEANESLSTRDFVMRIKICKKEAKESHLWLRLMFSEVGLEGQTKLKLLIQEALELSKIFGAIIGKFKPVQ
jgi:four helix bundle protein